jgi:hypothetical protein
MGHPEQRLVQNLSETAATRPHPCFARIGHAPGAGGGYLQKSVIERAKVNSRTASPRGKDAPPDLPSQHVGSRFS